jgi:hypothetical protein
MMTTYVLSPVLAVAEIAIVPPRGKSNEQWSAGESDSGPGHQLDDSTTAFHFDSAGVAWIHTDDRPLSTDPQVQV